jgi:meso-butanediol dehydrogenase/(S,S)-butanediol dehydrogenase/diacetyl reductase
MRAQVARGDAPTATTGAAQKPIFLGQEEPRMSSREDAESRTLLTGKVAIITGGTSGIGEATARLFAREGAKVAFTGRRTDRGRALAEEINASGGDALFTRADHTSPGSCRNVIDRVVERYDGIDILFNNAGIVPIGTAESTSDDLWRRTMELNVTAVWRMSALVLPHMRKRGGGVIVNNASDWGLVGGRNAVAYCTSKGAVVQMTRAMALDHAHENIRVNAVCPGETFVARWEEDGYHTRSGTRTIREYVEQVGSSLPLGRVAEPEEVARVVLFLASAHSSFMTGAVVPVDGGDTAR